MSRTFQCDGQLLSVLVFVLLVQSPGWAEPKASTLQLALPVECDRNTGCLIQNYFDHDSGPGFADHTCGSLGYNGHDGIDFRLKNLSVMHSGVAVRAAAPGRVRAIRDEMPDVSIREPGQLTAIAGREAGNSVAIRHAGGWETQYSHLKRGSIRVAPGDDVEAGEVLGLVGLSGMTEFPHLHLSVRYEGEPVDPFVGVDQNFECGDETTPLWGPEARGYLSYRPTGIIQAGFAEKQPDLESVESGDDNRQVVDIRADAIVFWIEAYGIKQGDQQVMTIFDPKGRVLVRHSEKFLKNRAKWFGYVGKKRRQDHWPVGRYQGKYILYRFQGGSEKLLELSRVVEVKTAN
ncbi:MAG: M23 family metallopeptidase [Sedimenticolaceae bacterium]